VRDAGSSSPWRIAITIVANEEGQDARKLRVRHDGSYSRDLKRKKAMIGGLRETWQKVCGVVLGGRAKARNACHVKEAERYQMSSLGARGRELKRG
jgi:hypothetical protein